MKFLLIAGYPDSIMNFRGLLLDSLRSLGLETHVAAPGLKHGEIRRTLESKGIIVHDVPLQRTGINPGRDIVTLFHLWRLMRNIRPDYVLGYTIKPVIYGSLAAFIARVPRRFALVTGLGYAFADAEQKGRRRVIRSLAQWLYAAALRRTEKVFFQNSDDESLFRSLGILDSNVPTRIVNGSGVDVDSFTVAPLVTMTLRFLLIARLLGDKGVREYVDAARQMRTQFPNVHFGLVGWIDENPDSITQQELDTWVAEGIVEYLGRLKDVRPAIANCSVYVLPSYREGTPRTVLEAMAMGRPIITTDAPGCRETVIDGVNGFLVPVKSSEDLVHAMKRFINQPELIEQMGQCSRTLAEKKYDVNKVNAIMLEEMGIK